MTSMVTDNAQIPDQFKESFLQYAEPLRFLAGETICHEGGFNRNLYLLTDGVLQISKKSDHGDVEKVVATLQAGDVFGEINFVFGTQRIATVSAISTATVYQLTPEQANTLIHENDELYTFLQTLGTKRWVSSLLLTLDLFSDLSTEASQRLLASSEHRTTSAGTRLYSVGDMTDRLYILLSGMLELQHLDDEAFEAKKGQCITPLEVLDNQPSTWRASTVSECIVASFPLTAIQKEREKNPVFADKLKETLINAE